MEIIQKLSIQQGFTATEKALAGYILDHAEEMAGMNIAMLAQRSFTSNPTIIRLCHKLGMSGYKEFRLKFVAELEKQRFETSDVDINYPFGLRDAPATIMKKIAAISQQALDGCYASVSPEEVNRAARMLLNAENIYIFASGDTAISAIGFSNMLMKLGIHPIMANQYDESMAIACNATGKDVALIVSYSGTRVQAIKKELRVMRRSGCRTILLTAADQIENMDLVIHFPAEERQFGKTAGYYSQMAIRYILNCLYGMIYMQDPQRNMEHKYRAETMSWQERDTEYPGKK